MNNVVDEVLAGSPKYKLTYSNGGSMRGVSIDLETEVVTQGTPLNKALFDSIRDDLNSRLPIDDKASESDAIGGTVNDKYMTPLRTKQLLNSYTILIDFPAGNSSETIYTFDNTSTAIIRIDGAIGTPSFVSNRYPSIRLNGSYHYYKTASDDWDSSNFAVQTAKTNSNQKCPFWFEFNMATKTFKGFVFTATVGGIQTTFSHTELYGSFTSLTSLEIYDKDTSIPIQVSVTEII